MRYVLALGVVLYCSACSSLEARQQQTQPRWEYYSWFASGRHTEAKLDSLGAAGWELVTAVMYLDTPTLYFKRLKP